MLSPYRLFGVDASPYTAKVRAVLRYRHLAHEWVCCFPAWHAETGAVRPRIMPVVRFPDGSYRTDSTPVVLALEAAHPGARSVLPDDPGAAFLARLVEDMADEWLTKCLFHYRFATPTDGEFAARWVMDDTWPGLDDDALAVRAAEFRARQVARMPLVGCTPRNAPLLETTLARVAAIVNGFAAHGRFLFGTRPSLADFGLYAQLRTLGADPTPMALLRACAPRIEPWVRRLDDASGVDGEWHGELATPPVTALAELAGTVYLPYLAANEAALAGGGGEFEVQLLGCSYRQTAFGYHARCLEALRVAYAGLAVPDLRRLAPLLEPTGAADVLRRRQVR